MAYKVFTFSREYVECDFKNINFFTGYLEQGLMVKDPKMLRRYYLKSDAWKYDFVSLLPTDFAYFWWRPGSCDYVSAKAFLFLFSVTYNEAFKPYSFFILVITESSILVVFQKRLPCPVILRLNRLFRLPRMWEWFDRTETATSYPNAFRICKVRQTIINYN